MLGILTTRGEKDDSITSHQHKGFYSVKSRLGEVKLMSHQSDWVFSKTVLYQLWSCTGNMIMKDNIIHNTKFWPFVIHNHLKRSQFCSMNYIMNDLVNDKKSHNIVSNKQFPSAKRE